MIGVTSHIREQTLVEYIIAQIKRKTWAWAGCVVRRTDSSWTGNSGYRETGLEVGEDY